ncbi:glycosyltransferase family 9 protein [Paracrocinitomix mangrovi]|uniref:glycosyltransferase family 9 protein n=1 Tax=Paracrocinitomix mangrovi TaxID=2862509 RepID=UPI001EDA14E1|nr:glycosyltransferase family 9 protein [Paracrocinitomix mangrovi]UKN00922.1 glycosyltransferase family 9 protein [Paracrocinitomix mangrovi]
MKKILIIRFSSIGDIVLTTPVIRCIKKQLDAEVHFITKKSYSSLFEVNPYVDKLWTIDKEVTEVTKALKEEKFDFIVDLHHNLRSFRLKSKLRRPSASFPKLNKHKWMLTKLKINKMPSKHIVDRYFEAVKPLGVKNDHAGLDYFIPEKWMVSLADYNIPRKYYSFVIGAKFGTKRLPNEKIIEIIQHLDKTVVILGGPEDVENAGKIEAVCENVVNVVGKINLHQSASILDRSEKVITHDTGLMHIAAAFKKEIVSIWGNTSPAFGMFPYIPNEEANFSIHEVELKCRPCSKIGYDRCPKGHFNCMMLQDTKAIVKDIQG